METVPDDEYYRSWLTAIPADIFLNPFSGEAAAGLAVMVLLLVCSALASASEVAYFSLSHKDIHDLRVKPTLSNNLVLKLLEKPRTLLATILIANNFFNVGLIITSYFVIQVLFTITSEWVELVLNAVAVTFLIVVFGEVIPKVYANYHNRTFAGFISRPMLATRQFFTPVSKVLIFMTRYMEKRFKGKGGENVTLDEIDHAIEISKDESTSDEEVSILKSIVKFGNITVNQVMRPRLDIVAVEISTGFDELLKLVVESGYSRIPVYMETLDNIEGVLYIKDLLPHLEGKDGFGWQDLIRPPFFVPEYKKIEELLHEFKVRKMHLALVVDEYGGTSGLITLEDVLEEIIGEIRDEYDEGDEIEFQKIDNANYIFEGKTLLNDLCRVMNIRPEIFEEVRGESDSLAGLLLELAKKLPDKDEVIAYKNFRFRIISVSKKRIQKVKVSVSEEELVER